MFGADFNIIIMRSGLTVFFYCFVKHEDYNFVFVNSSNEYFYYYSILWALTFDVIIGQKPAHFWSTVVVTSLSFVSSAVAFYGAEFCEHPHII